MAKQLTIKDKRTSEVYTLEYTRKTVKMMEQNGFVVEDLTKKPMTLLPTLFAGAFLAHHRWVKQDVIESIYKELPHKDNLIGVLIEMYNDPIMTLFDEPDGEGDEGNLTWTAGW